MSEKVTTMFGINTDGDIDVSSNGVIRTVSGTLNTTNVSAIIMLNTIKGSYIFSPQLGLAISKISDIEPVQGMSTRDQNEETIESLITLELEKDPNILSVTNFVFDYTNIADRQVGVSFTINTPQGGTNTGVIL